MSSLEFLEENIKVIKDNLQTLPKNNKEDKDKINSYISDALLKYKSDLDIVLNEIIKRSSNAINAGDNFSNSDIFDTLDNYDISYFLDDYKSSYEKLNFDVPLYDIDHFYSLDLEKVNDDIKFCIDVFNKAKIKYDFNYSIYAKEYIDSLYDNSLNIVDIFKKIYSKCPDILLHLELNIKSIYYKNRKGLEKYYLSLRSKNNLDEYHNLRKNCEKYSNEDSSYIYNRFINKDLNIKDFLDTNSLYEKYNFTDINNIYNLYHDLEEYKYYLQFKYIFDDILEKYKEKDKYKGLYVSKFNEIIKTEKSLFKLNKIIFKLKNKKGLSDKLKKKLSLSIVNANGIISKLKELYDELLNLRIYDKILLFLDDSSSIYDVLVFGSSFYDYMVDLLRKDNPSISTSDIKNEILKVRRYICGPYFSIIKNIDLNSSKDLSVIISDKYKLLDVSVDSESLLDVSSIDKILDDLKIILISESFKTFNYTVSDIDFYLRAKSIVGDKL